MVWLLSVKVGAVQATYLYGQIGHEILEILNRSAAYCVHFRSILCATGPHHTVRIPQYIVRKFRTIGAFPQHNVRKFRTIGALPQHIVRLPQHKVLKYNFADIVTGILPESI